ncbi:hypothetical protein BN7_3273 [Wickerhamomyces ciferrii]|uniref:Uncharacterized protein n=1 Tax=Wickerhamomyces ciferrii (strain ATCC 14091 / BCRC 22168 / CBS 111 / JCM 3599 / NBRC 0793 / NRRL Y-1031 F-60-10) TaxID=1206466 RepID=K0KQY3_WICCF|nr:uncharacterized protein BN7_3273 [Wickerhamomyces ciferrii]CCH43719.1 hypothetical protein BN7_3273 [Wickerhamomyces ciferrii]
MNQETSKDSNTPAGNGHSITKSFDIRDLILKQQRSQQESKIINEPQVIDESVPIAKDESIYEPPSTPKSNKSLLTDDSEFQTLKEIKQELKDDEEVPIILKSPIDRVEAYKERHINEVRNERAQRAQNRGLKRSSSPMDDGGYDDDYNEYNDDMKNMKKRVKFDLPDDISTDEDDDEVNE